MIKNVGGTEIKQKHRASCHCGAVVLELDLPDGIVNPRRCDCSICRRKGAIVASIPLAGITIIQGQDALRLYEFNTLLGARNNADIRLRRYRQPSARAMDSAPA